MAEWMITYWLASKDELGTITQRLSAVETTGERAAVLAQARAGIPGAGASHATVQKRGRQWWGKMQVVQP